MKQKTKKQKNKDIQGILCEVVDVFQKNGIDDNQEIVNIFSAIDTHKLRGVKRSLTLKKNKLRGDSKKAMKFLKKGEEKFGSQQKQVLVDPPKTPKHVYSAINPEIRKFIAFNKFFNQITENLDKLNRHGQNKHS